MGAMDGDASVYKGKGDWAPRTWLKFLHIMFVDAYFYMHIVLQKLWQNLTLILKHGCNDETYWKKKLLCLKFT